MAFRTQKISQMTPKGSDLEATDLIEVSTIESGSYVTRSITGQELIDAIPVPPSGITIGTTAITSGTVGRVLFEGTGNVVQQSANLFWDNTNGRLGIGGVTPFYNLIIYNASAPSFALQNSSRVWQHYLSGSNYRFGTSAADMINIAGATGNVGINTFTDAGFRLDVNGTARVSGLLSTPAGVNLGGWYLYANGTSNASMFGGSSWIFDTVSGGGYRFRTTGLVDRLRIESTGNVLINTTTDAGFKLDVNGTARVSGQLTVSTGGASITGDLVNNGYTSSNGLRSVSSGALNLYNTRYIAGNGILIDDFNAAVYNNITHNTFNLSGIYTVNSGSSSSILTMLNITRTLNIAAGTNTIRGIYYNPTLTSTVGITNHYAFHSTIGRIRFENLPTSSAGLSAGDIWNDAGTLKIV